MDKSVLRAYYNKYTIPARTSAELQLQKDLTNLDKDLHLRWNWHKHSWSVYYDHNGVLSSIKTFKPGDGFRQVYQSIACNGKTTKRDLIFKHKDAMEENERVAKKAFDEAQYQARHELGNMDRGRVISMQTDSKKSAIVG